MKYITSTFLFTFLLPIFLFSQQTEHVHKLYMPLLLGSGYGYEWSIISPVTLNVGIDYRSYIGDEDFALDNVVFSPRIHVEPRYYYNIKKRHAKGKNTAFNSANYFSIAISREFEGFDFGAIRDSPEHVIRMLPSLGLRRVLANHFTIDLSIFAGYKTGPLDQLTFIEAVENGKRTFGGNVILAHVF